MGCAENSERFTSGQNVYGYVNGNPISYIDPEGLDAATIRASAAGLGSLGPVGYVAGAGVAGYALGTGIYPHIAEPLGNAIDRMCRKNDKEKNCRALYDNIIQNTCAGIKDRRKQQRCWEAAAKTFEECMSQD